jgi:hypothetical protein
MPSGKIHAIVTCLAAGVLVLSLHTLAGMNTPSVIALSLGALTGVADTLHFLLDWSWR